MTRKCGKCGIPAPDDEAVFCNRCGAGIIEETEPEFPLCPSCGMVVSDELAEFCNRCGTRIPAVPPVCPGCGIPAIDNESQFCTRCGTPFSPTAVPAKKKESPAKKTSASVLVQPRKSVHPKLPAKQEPESDWDPWSDEGTFEETPAPLPVHNQKKYAHLPLFADEPAALARDSDRQVSVPPKKYAHLPMIAEELRDKNTRSGDYDGGDLPGSSPKGRKPPQKKGMLGRFK